MGRPCQLPPLRPGSARAHRDVIERVVEKVVIEQDSQCVENLLEASKLISATAAKLQESRVTPEIPIRWGPISGVEPFPTLDAMERAMIVAAYRKSNRKPIEAARMLGIGKTTFYRKLREIRRVAAWDPEGDRTCLTEMRSGGTTLFASNDAGSASTGPGG